MQPKTIRFRKLHLSVTLLCVLLLALLWLRLLTSSLNAETLTGKVFLIGFYVLSTLSLASYILVSIVNRHCVEIGENGISVYSSPFRLRSRQDFVEPFESFYVREYHLLRYAYLYDVLGETNTSKVIIVSDLEKKDAQAVVDFLNEYYKNFGSNFQ